MTDIRLDPHLDEILSVAARGRGRIVVLTGAGISAESGIPTFRGGDGFWTVGSRNYHPQELATHATFARRPEVVWPWYLHRLGVCLQAEPNAGHRALGDLEGGFGERFVVVTQNVDGMHLRAGNSEARTWQIHGNIAWMRCDRPCHSGALPVPAALARPDRSATLEDDERATLRCASCGGWMRPHVLWFDESYDEENYRFHSSLRAADEAGLLIVVGTSGATNLPIQMGRAVAARRGALVDVNPEHNPFAALAERLDEGHFAQGTAAALLPAIVDRLLAAEKAR